MSKRERRKLEAEHISIEEVQSRYDLTPKQFETEQNYYDPELNSSIDDDSDEARDIIISVNVTNSDELFLDRKARELGLSKSEIVRLLVRKAKRSNKVI